MSVSWTNLQESVQKVNLLPLRGVGIYSSVMEGWPGALLVLNQKQFPVLLVPLQPAGLEPPVLYLSLSSKVGHAGHVSLDKAEINHTPAPA